MDSMLDVAKQGQVQQDVGANMGQSMAQGAQLAQAYQTHQAAMQEHQAKMAQFQEQQAQWANTQIATISGIQNPNLRAQRFKQFQKSASVAGVQVDPGWETLIKDDATAQNIGRAQAQIHGLPYDQKMAAYQDNMRMMGDAAEGEKALMNAGTLTEQRYATNVGAQVQGVQMQREMGFRQMEQGSKDFAETSARNKDAYDALRSANFVNQTLTNPKASPIEIADAKGVVDKVVNMGAILRPQTMNMLGDSSQGLIEDAKQLASQLAGKGKITDKQRGALLNVVNRFAAAQDLELSNQQNEYEKSHPGVDSAYVFSNRPKLQDFGQPGSASALAQVQNNDHPGPAFTASISPQAQSATMARAAQMGIKLDPKAPDFATQLASFRAKLQEQMSSVAQQAPQGVSAPAGGGQ